MTKFKTITVICVLFFSIGLFAQEHYDSENHTREGRILLGASTNGGLNFSNSSFKLEGQTVSKNKSNLFSLTGSAGYFFVDNLVGGVELSFATSNFKSDLSDSESSAISFLAGPFASYYFDIGNSKIRPYLKASTGFGFGKSESNFSFINGGDDPTIQTEESKQRSFVWRAGAGIAFFLNDTISINVEVAYRNNSNKILDDEFNSKSKSSNIGLNGGLSIFL